MDQKKLSEGLLSFLENLNNDEKIGNWIYLGLTTDKFGSRGGSWDNIRGFKFKSSDTQAAFILRSIPNLNGKSFIVIESYNLNGQLYNMDLSNHRVYNAEEGSSKLLESYILTAGKGRVNKQDVKNAFKSLGHSSNIIYSIKGDFVDWKNLINNLLNWGVIREKAKKIVLEEKKKRKSIKNVALMDEKVKVDIISNKYPLNQILYGPPGTGKTYQTISKTIEIVNPQFYEANKRNRTKLTERFKELLISDWSESKGQIAFCTFHQSFTYEDFVEGIKPEIKKDQVSYDIQDGIFKLISDLAGDNWYASNTQNSENKILFPDAFKQLKDEWEEDNDILFPMKRNGYDFKIIGFTSKSIQFEKQSGSTNHTLSIETLKKGFLDESSIRSTGVGIYYPPIIKRLKSYVSKDNEIQELKPYVIIIDEINRGNVAAIFGELITLIEENKRAYSDEELSVMLPYSKKEFSVPKNLYIIGTMNTADRSVEALDSALRRRFSFEEVMPNYEVIDDLLGEKNEWNKIQISQILERINKRIIQLIDRDHQIGHSYFLKLTKAENITNELKNIFSQNIIPLLQEYFFNDSNKLGLVLGEGFLNSTKQENDEGFWAEFNNGDGSDYEDEIYEVKDPIKMTDEEFISAIKKLIN